tara:strand:+ start:1821 stop:2408 length:588 start_codon:yes stop_codon:yes gene_type:complete
MISDKESYDLQLSMLNDSYKIVNTNLADLIERIRSKVYTYSYLNSDTNPILQPSDSTFYPVGGATPFTEGASNTSGVVKTSGSHALIIPEYGAYRINATIVMEIEDIQGSVEWEGRIMKGTVEIAYVQRHYTDYPHDGVSSQVNVWRNTIHLHTIQLLAKDDNIRLEVRCKPTDKVIYLGSNDGSRTNFSIERID